MAEWAQIKYRVVVIVCCLNDCRADAAAKGDERAAKLPDIVSAANDVISAINATELAAFLAMRAPADTEGGADGSSSGSNGGGSGGSSGSNGGSSSSAVDSYKETKAEKDKEKAALLEALKTKLKAQLDLAEVRDCADKLVAGRGVQGRRVEHNSIFRTS
jgi:hypothetical protein